MNRTLGLFFIFLFALSAFAQSSGTITGKVTFADDRSTIHEASIQIVELRRTLTTGDDGSYTFTDVPPGRYTILVHQQGFSDITRTVTVTAGGSTESNFQLSLTGIHETVTVTASGTEQSTFEAIASVSSVDSNTIRQRAAVGLGDVLNGEPGVAKRSLGPGNSRPVIRGFDGDRVLVSTDGVRVGSLAAQSGDHAEPVDVLAAERIEVVKGPATLLYGSNAIGGVVNSISGHDDGPHPGTRGYFSTVGGTNSHQGAISGGLEYGIGRWMLWTNATGQRTSDYKAGGDFGTVENTFTRSASGTIGGGYYGKNAFVNSTFTYYQNRYGIPLDFTDPEAEQRTLRMWRNNLKFNFGYNNLDWVITGAKFTVDFSNYRHQELVEGDVGTTFRNKVFSYRGMFEQKQTGMLSGRFGFEGFGRKYQTVGEEVLIAGPVKQNSFSVFALEELKHERFTFQFGGRVENNRYNPTDPRLTDRDFTGFSGAAGFRAGLWTGGAFVANYSHSYRAPALEELYNNGPHDGTLSFEIGNRNLQAERSNGIDLALRHQTGRLRGEANFFYYSIGDFIFLAPTGIRHAGSGLEIANYTQGDSRFRGTELNLDVTAHKYVNILAGLDYVNAELKDGRPLPRIAPVRTRFGADIHRGNFSVRPELVAVGRQDRLFTNETPTAGYAVVNVAGSYIVPRQHYAHIFSVNAFNLNDKLFYNHISFLKEISPETGRGARFSYTIRFF
ncbi:MAG: TonB-dependent receptor [Pyrinomonadaceae bacterium]